MRDIPLPQWQGERNISTPHQKEEDTGWPQYNLYAPSKGRGHMAAAIPSQRAIKRKRTQGNCNYISTPNEEEEDTGWPQYHRYTPHQEVEDTCRVAAITSLRPIKTKRTQRDCNYISTPNQEEEDTGWPQ